MFEPKEHMFQDLMWPYLGILHICRILADVNQTQVFIQ